MNQPEFQITNDIRLVPDALILHDKVFAEGLETLFNSKEEWLRRINNGGYFVVCTSGSAVVGYAVCDITETDDFKIWLVGVDSDFRQQGIWTLLYTNIIKHALSESRSHVLLNTFPAKFPAMYAFLQSVGAEIYEKKLVDGDEKYYAKIRL